MSPMRMVVGTYERPNEHGRRFDVPQLPSATDYAASTVSSYGAAYVGAMMPVAERVSCLSKQATALES
jgi:hypothetical protein